MTPRLLRTALFAAALVAAIPAAASAQASVQIPKARPALEAGATVSLPPFGTEDGRTLTIEQFRGRVVVFFFARRQHESSAGEAQLLSRAARHWEGDGLAVIAVHLDDTPASTAGPFLTVGLPQGAAAVAARLGHPDTPSAAVVDREGRLVATHLRGAAMLSVIAEQLGAPLPPAPADLFAGALDGDLDAHDELLATARQEPDTLVPLLTQRVVLTPPSPAAAELCREITREMRHARPDRFTHYLAAHAAWYAGDPGEAAALQHLALEQLEEELRANVPGRPAAAHPAYVDVACRLALFEAAAGHEARARQRLALLHENAEAPEALAANFWYVRATELAAPRVIETSASFR